MSALERSRPPGAKRAPPRRGGDRCHPAPRRSALAVAFLACAFFHTLIGESRAKSLAPPDGRPYVIGRIRIDARPVFDDEGLDPQILTDLPEILANALHYTTRDEVVRREVLLAPGDRYDPLLVAESERNLRALGFIADAEIVPRFHRDGTVDLEVTTRDKFTLRFSFGGSFLGGKVSGNARIGESNLFGYGKVLKATALASDEDKLVRVKYQDPRVLGSRYALDVTAALAESGERVEVLVERPFYALEVWWSWGGGAGYRSAVEDFFEDGDESATVPTEESFAEGFLAHAWGTRVRRLELEGRVTIRRTRFGVREASDGVALAAGDEVPPPDRTTTTLRVTPRIEWYPTWLERERVDTLDGIEDIPLGVTLGVLGGVAYWHADGPPAWQVPLGAFLEASFRIPWLDQLGVLSASTEWRLAEGGVRAFEAAVGYRHYVLDLLPSQTLALSIDFETGWDDDDLPVQLTVGEDSGLRGFKARAFEGNKRLRVSVEDRIFTPLELYSVRVGGVAFLDAGYAWERGEEMALDDLEASAGVGLRFGSRRLLGRSVVRLDLGFPLTEGRFGSELSVSISTGQVFGLFGVVDELEDDGL